MTLPRRPLAVIFDMDGVIFDTERLYRDALLTVSREAGYTLTDPVFHRMVGSPWPANRAFLIDHYGPDYPADAIRDQAHARMHAIMDQGPYLKHGLVELLDALDVWAMPRAIATSSHHDAVERNLAAHGLAERFPIVVAHGDYAQGKPAPDPFLTAAARLGVAPHYCVALEDSHHGVRSAASAGMMTVMVPDLLEASDRIQGLCTAVAIDLLAVRDLIGTALD